MQQVTVLGTGVLGSQIIFQAAYKGKDVVAYDISDDILAKLPERWEYLKKAYRQDLPDATDAALDAAVSRIRATSISRMRSRTPTSSSRRFPSGLTSSRAPGAR
jgi:3-hydroxybutyryl-CoA dehydrogenase